MKIIFKYSYLKILYKKFHKKLNTGSLTSKKVRHAVMDEIGIVKSMAINNKNTINRSHRVHLERTLKKKIPNFIFAEHNKDRHDKANKHLRAISNSVRIFLADAIAKEKAEKEEY